MLLKKKELVSKILIFLFLIAYFLPNFNAIDRIGYQWFYLSIISLISITYLLFENELVLRIRSLFNEKGILFYSLFIIWALLSITYSINSASALVTINQYFTVFTTLIFLRLLLLNINNGVEFILKLFLTLLIFEVVLCLYPILIDLENGNLTFRAMRYSGAASNINITAFSLLYKSPILLYFLTKENKPALKFVLSFLLFIILFIVSILGTRGAYLGVIPLFVSYLFYLFFIKEHVAFKIQHLLIVFSVLTITVLSNLYLSEKNSNVLSRASSISVNTQDGSVNQRIRYYKQGLNHFINNPLIGVGVGNWKLKSIDYDKNNIRGFIIPYHAHNDLVQLLAELGILGALTYLLFIYFSVKKLFISRIFKNKIHFLLLGSISIYFIDSMLNFPIARPISQLYLVCFICLISLHKDKV
mgnify:FL=1